MTSIVYSSPVTIQPLVLFAETVTELMSTSVVSPMAIDSITQFRSLTTHPAESTTVSVPSLLSNLNVIRCGPTGRSRANSYLPVHPLINCDSSVSANVTKISGCLLFDADKFSSIFAFMELLLIEFCKVHCFFGSAGRVVVLCQKPK